MWLHCSCFGPHAENSKVALDQANRRVQELQAQVSSLQAQLGEAQKQLAAWQGKVGLPEPQS